MPGTARVSRVSIGRTNSCTAPARRPTAASVEPSAETTTDSGPVADLIAERQRDRDAGERRFDAQVAGFSVHTIAAATAPATIAAATARTG